ncbi:hypothetical protein FJV46_13720 [Arthrobacter agilis]|uniref:DUF6098 family protein n=1 Tax=Arthrobacter agilis TaxID=37921 RepID=UPI000B3619B3|nr:DUF6098 family protein [Arthrobacter agilis]OUM44777.1 hypothetical protein B8W74_02530 [Arthrobacter agilis]PPB47101.1 hypothetical protein CI784_03560 [Arthrobacter agilis]TPV22516.1 hypothetical protein FJV46_13720 [Arthrobacter agilis]VDR32338.1 Uncharacterised protein [Arthrobacter agilis]
MDTASQTHPIGTGRTIIRTLAELGRILQHHDSVYLRYSRGYEADRDSTSRDGESGLVLPGLSVNPLTPEDWWTRPLEDWLARQICQYRHVAEEEDRCAWILTGTTVGRGPDCEPLLVDVTPLGTLHEGLLQEAVRIYGERFEAGKRP